MAAAMNWKIALGFGALALLGFVIVAALFPALMLILLLFVFLGAMAMFAPKFAGSPAGIAIIVIVLILIVIFGVIYTGAGQGVSLSIVRSLP